MALHACGQAAFFQLRQLLFYGSAHFHDVRTAGSCDEDSLRPFAVEEQFVAGRFFVSFLDAGDVAHAELVVVMPLYQHAAYVFHCPELVADGDADAVVAIVVVAAVGGLVLSVQGGEDFGGLYAEVCHTVLQQGDVDAFGTFAVQFHPFHARHIAYFALDKLCIVGQLPVGQSVTGQCVEHSVYIAEVVFHDGGARSVRQQGAGVAHLAAQHVPALLHFIVRGNGGEFYLYQGEVVVRVAFHIIYIAHAADALLQHIRHFQLYLVGGCPRIGGYHHGEFHFYFRVFQFAHLVAGEDAAYKQDGHQEVNQIAVFECPFAYIHNC